MTDIHRFEDEDGNEVKFPRATSSEQAKHAGLKSLTQVMEISGVSLQTLINWHRDKPKLFYVVILGCVEKLKDES